MAESTIWWIVTGVAVALELLTGTFYLLLLAVGLAAAAVAAHAGVTLTVQLVVAAVVGGGSVVVWRSRHRKTKTALPAGANRDVNLDVGETVQVDSWETDGTSSVKYRGANWNVSLVADATPSTGLHVIVEIIGSRLIVKKL